MAKAINIYFLPRMFFYPLLT